MQICESLWSLRRVYNTLSIPCLEAPRQPFLKDHQGSGCTSLAEFELQIEEAKLRLSSAMRDHPELSGKFSADFIASADIGNIEWEDEKGPYDAVTCMFALHYFFRSEESARKALAMAARNLKPQGHFFGVLPDGRNVMNAIGESMKPKQYKAVRLAPRWPGDPQPFGSAYTCALTDTVTEVCSRFLQPQPDLRHTCAHVFWSKIQVQPLKVAPIS
jgi:SAM-dependent methyltransferase